jgi:hypothetical protein
MYFEPLVTFPNGFQDLFGWRLIQEPRLQIRC